MPRPKIQRAVHRKQGLTYAPGISAETVGSKALHLQIVTIPPGAKARAHKHESHETAIYILTAHPACITARA